jgi:hypothetical protein
MSIDAIATPIARTGPSNEWTRITHFVINGHPRANRQKPSGIAAKETVLRVAPLGESPDQSIKQHPIFLDSELD